MEGTGKLPQHLVETAELLTLDLLAENKDETLIHGDFHHYNVLESERGWLAIDPKGVIGPRGYEVGPLLDQPGSIVFKRKQSDTRKTEKRIAILSEMLGMEREAHPQLGSSAMPSCLPGGVLRETTWLG